MAASDVDLPEPVAPTKMTRPRVVIATSFRIGGRSRSANSGISERITRNTTPTDPRWVKALTRKRETPGRLMAKLHSWVASNSAIWRSFIIERTSTWVCCGLSDWFDNGVILPSTFIEGTAPAVMNRSDPSFCTIIRRRSCMYRMALSRSISPHLLEFRASFKKV